MEDVIQTLPNNEFMIKHDLTLKESLRFYKNTWTRYLASRMIDVEADRQRVAIDPKTMVMHGDKDQMGRYFEEQVPVTHRLELRKKLIENALETLKAIDALMQTPDDAFEATHLSEKALGADEAVVREMLGEEAVEPADNPTPAPTEEPTPAVAEDAAVPAPEETPAPAVEAERVETPNQA